MTKFEYASCEFVVKNHIEDLINSGKSEDEAIKIVELTLLLGICEKLGGIESSIDYSK